MRSTARATTLSPDSIVRFQRSLSARGMSANTVAAYSTDLRTLLNDSPTSSVERLDFEEVATEWLNRYVTKMSPKTSRRRLTSLRAFVKWAGWEEDMYDLFSYKSPEDVAPQPHPLPEGIDGVHKLIEDARKPHHKALVAQCGLVGMRVSEALAADASWYDFNQMQVRILGKGNKTRFVPISDAAFEAITPAFLMAYASGGKLVTISDRSARMYITRAGDRLGFKRSISSHDLRATFATAVYDKTKDMNVVRQLLGHSSVETTQVYVGTEKSALRGAVEL